MAKDKVKISLSLLDFAMNNAIPKLAKEILSAKTSYWLNRTIKVLSKEHSHFIETKNKLVSQYAKKDENGKVVQDKETRNIILEETTKDQFWKEYSELLGQEIDIDIWQVSLDDLKDTKLSPADLDQIDFIIKIEDDGTSK